MGLIVIFNSAVLVCFPMEICGPSKQDFCFDATVNSSDANLYGDLVAKAENAKSDLFLLRNIRREFI